MVPDRLKTSVGMEYFCNEGDEIWATADADLIDMAARELAQLGLVATDDVSDGFVVRQPKAYPVYQDQYQNHLSVIRAFTDTIANLQTIGRNGMYRYNNMDHSMHTGMLAAENIFGAQHDLWTVNEADEYLEEDKKRWAEKILTRTFARMDQVAFATAVGSVAGLLIFCATIWLILKGGEVVGPNLQLLAQYFIGYTVSIQGAFIAFGYSICWGFLFGWLYAYLRNFFLSYYIYRIKKKTEMLSFSDFFDQL